MNLNTRSFDNEFVEQSVAFGDKMRELRAYRDSLNQQYADLVLKKMDIALNHADESSVQVKMDQISETRSRVREEIDELLDHQAAHLRNCLIRH